MIAVSSAVAWAGTLAMHNRFMPIPAHAPGIDLLFVPSGVRMIALMIGGFWAALGVGLGALFVTGAELNTTQPLAIVLVAACAGFCPYLALRMSMRAVGVETGLGNLRPAHLPFISLGVALGSSLLHNLLFSLLGIAPWSSFGEHVLAMAAGDFVGILLAVVTVFVFLRVLRKPAS